MALAPTSASAWHKHHHHHHGLGFGIGFVDPGYNSCYRTRMVLTPYGYRLRTINVCALLIEPRSARFQKSPGRFARPGFFRRKITGTRRRRCLNRPYGAGLAGARAASSDTRLSGTAAPAVPNA